MSAPVCMNPAKVMNPRARHYLHQHEGMWHVPSYVAWLDRQIHAWLAEQPPGEQIVAYASAVTGYGPFDAWLAARCGCGDEDSAAGPPPAHEGTS